MIETWIDEFGLVIIGILAGFLITILVTKTLNRGSGSFALVMILSIIYCLLDYIEIKGDIEQYA